MRGDRVLVRFIGGVLNRRIVEYVVLFRYDDDTAGMLSRGDLDVLTALRDSLPLGFSKHLSRLLLVLAHVVKRRALRYSADRTRAERMPATKHLLDVLMRRRLIFAGEVQVDIRRLISVETKENLKRDVESHLVVARAADGAIPIWHVDSTEILQPINLEIAVLAVRADIVRLQRVDLRDARHGRDKRGADRTAGADEVTVGVALVNQPLRHEVERGKAVADDGLELSVEPCLHDFRQRIAVDFVRFVNRHVAQDVVCVFDGRRVCAVRERLEHLDEVRDAVWLVHHDAARGLLAKIGEFGQHLGGRLVIQRRLKRGILEAVLREDHLAVDRVLRVEKMHVSRRNNGYFEAVSKGDDLAVDVEDPLLGGLVFTHEKRVVAARLNLQKVIGLREILHPLLAGFVQNRLIQLARLAGRAKDQPLAIERKQAERNGRVIVKVIQVRVADDAVEVLHARLRFREYDDVVRLRALLLPRSCLVASERTGSS